MPRPRVLIVDDKLNMLRLCRALLEHRYDVETTPHGEAARQRIEEQHFDVVVTDVRMPHLDGRSLLDVIKGRDPSTQVILITAFGSIERAVDAMRAGAFDYLTKPFDPDALEAAVQRALEQRQAAVPEEERTDTRTLDPMDVSYREALTLARERTSQRYLTALLRFCEGNVTYAADLAGMERESLHRLMRRHHIHSEDFRALASGAAPGVVAPSSEQKKP